MREFERDRLNYFGGDLAELDVAVVLLVLFVDAVVTTSGFKRVFMALILSFESLAYYNNIWFISISTLYFISKG